jgi:hypothetical protein
MDFLMILAIAMVFSIGTLLVIQGKEKWPDKAQRLHRERRFSFDAIKGLVLNAATTTDGYVNRFRMQGKNEQIQREIYSALSILRNHAAAECVSTDFLLEYFSQAEGPLREAYAGALRLLRTGRYTEAAEYFSAAAGISFARDFILLILDWDAIDPGRQKQTIVAFQNALKEARTTELMRKNEVMSDLVYMPVVTGVLIIFVNFIYIAYFAEQRALLSELFF